MRAEHFITFRVPSVASARIRIAPGRVLYGAGYRWMGCILMADEIGDRLRDMAAHRGLKLVKSRRRKPGTGDYGHFGLTDLSGKPLLGIGDDGLTATAKDVETYLRKGATETWKTSAAVTPARPASTRREERVKENVEIAIRPRAKSKATQKIELAGKSARRKKSPASADSPRGTRHSQRKAIEQVKQSEATPEPQPDLVIRTAHSADAAALAPLLSQLAQGKIDELAVARNLDAVRKAKGGMALAEFGDLIGFCSWAVIPTVQHGSIGRITLLLVDEDHRRRGFATALVNAAVEALRKAGCTRVEAMSDIAIANAHGFFRTLKFEQTSYRFARDIMPE